ncbi:MAG: YjjW family glycine radical enzyme activase [Acidimicrobiia bacterium]|nr:YjjW family glycine radical enzyme activase [Acidimicrobiia bacterium]
MSSVRGLLNNVLPFSSVDGPGNRSVVFLQGCNLACVYCHNPYTIGLCTHCGECIEPCPEDALSAVDGKVVVDWEACTRCGICIDVCPESSTPLAETVTATEVVDRVRRSAPFVSGVTISGGEATVQPDFLVELTAAFKDDPTYGTKSVLIDSNGKAPTELWDRLAPTIDGVMLDLKAWDPQDHERLTGSGHTEVLDSLAHLSTLGLLTEVRFVLVPGWNDDPDILDAMADHLADGGVPLKLIRARHHGVSDPVYDEPSVDHAEAVAERFRARGIAVRIV